MNAHIEHWDGQLNSACAIIDLAEKSLPVTQPVHRADAVDFLRTSQGEFHDGTLVLRMQDRLVGFAMLCSTPSGVIADLIGVIHPKVRRHGHAKRLLRELLLIVKRYPAVECMRGRAFDTHPAAHPLFLGNGFRLADVQFWSEWRVGTVLPEWAQQKERSADRGGLKFVRGDEFEAVRPDWAESWWRLVMEAASDVPSRVASVTVPFEQWRARMEPPHTQRAHSILALNGTEPVGVISLGLVTDGKVNIGFTGVASSHRRQGLSTALKIKAMALAKSIGAHALVTQNHQDNPMLQLNRRLGFQKVNEMTEYTRSL